MVTSLNNAPLRGFYYHSEPASSTYGSQYKTITLRNTHMPLKGSHILSKKAQGLRVVPWPLRSVPLGFCGPFSKLLKGLGFRV